MAFYRDNSLYLSRIFSVSFLYAERWFIMDFEGINRFDAQLKLNTSNCNNKNRSTNTDSLV